jgi:hypothetical protein
VHGSSTVVPLLADANVASGSSRIEVSFCSVDAAVVFRLVRVTEVFRLPESTGRLAPCMGVTGRGVDEQLVQVFISSAPFLLMEVISVLEQVRAFILSMTDQDVAAIVGIWSGSRTS